MPLVNSAYGEEVKMPTCPSCGQRIRPERPERFGVQLTSFKARLVDIIKDAGKLGVSTDDIMRTLYLDRPKVGPATVKAHVWQINELLSETNYSIVSDQRRWFLRKV
jgi:hypothetical protein